MHLYFATDLLLVPRNHSALPLIRYHEENSSILWIFIYSYRLFLEEL